MQNISYKNSTRYAWAVVGMLWCICFLNYADRQAISAIFPVLEKQFGFSKFQLGMIGSIFMWIYAGGAFFAGFLSDRMVRVRLILGGCFFWSAVTACTGLCSKFWQFLTVRALEGMGEAFYFPASNSLITDYHSQKTRSTALGCHQSSVYVGTIAGSSLGAWLAAHYGWYWGFYFFGGLGVVLSAVLFFFLKEPEREKAILSGSEECPQLSMLATLHYFFKRPAVVLLLLTFVSANFVGAIFLTWMPTFLYEKFHMTLTTAGFFAVAFVQLSSALSAPVHGWFADRLTSKWLHGRVLAQLLSLLIGSIAIVAIGRAATETSLIIAMIAFGICKGGYDIGIFASVFDHIEPDFKGSAVGLMNTFGWTGGALGPLILGAIVTYGGTSATAINRMSATISASAGAYLLGVIFLTSLLVITRKKSHQ